MGYKCSAYGCSSGYVTKKQESSSSVGNASFDTKRGILFHAYPINNKFLCERWERANPRQNFKATKHSRLCSLHFQPSDFIIVHGDSNKQRAKKYNDKHLTLKILKKGSFLSVFPNTPSYLSKSINSQNTKTTTAASRLKKQAEKYEHLEQCMMVDDNISNVSIEELFDKLQKEKTIPSGYTINVIDKKLLIYMLDASGNSLTIRLSITVNNQGVVVVCIDGKRIPACRFKDLIKEKICFMSQLINLMARAKTWLEEFNNNNSQLLISMAIESLKLSLKSLEEDGDENKKVTFIIEQLQLLSRHKLARFYSPQLTILSYIINSTSSSAYCVLRDEKILTLPSVTTLGKVARRVGMHNSDGLGLSNYLKLRTSKLNGYQQKVILLIDEIYIAKRIEYSGGRVKGLTFDGNVASILLCFMAKSIAGKYKDIVGIYPVCNFIASKLYKCY